MGTTDSSDRVFRDNLRRQRESQGLSLAQLAKLLQDKGLKVYPTTIAKVEYGERPAKLDEVIALADVFGVSIDALVGRSGRQRRRGDKALAVEALQKRADTTAKAVDALEVGLRELMEELDDLALRKDETAALAEAGKAAEALAGAAVATRRAADRLRRAQRRTMQAFLADDSHDTSEEHQKSDAWLEQMEGKK